MFNDLSTFFKIHRSPGYAQAAKTDHRFPSNRSALASGAVSPGPSLPIKTGRHWPLGRHPLDHRFPFKQVGSGFWAASYGPCLPSKIDRLWPLGRHPLSAVRARDNGSSGQTYVGYSRAMHRLCTESRMQALGGRDRASDDPTGSLANRIWWFGGSCADGSEGLCGDFANRIRWLGGRDRSSDRATGQPTQLCRARI